MVIAGRRTRVENGAVPDQGGETTHTTAEAVSNNPKDEAVDSQLPVELVDLDGAKGLLAVGGAGGLDLRKR